MPEKAKLREPACLFGRSQRCLHLGRVSLRLHLLKHLRNHTVRPDQKRRAQNASVAHSVHHFLAPHSVRISYAVAVVHEQPVRQIEFVPELPMRFRIVGVDSQNHCIEFPEPGKSVAEFARFLRSAGGVVLRIKEQHDVSPGEICQTHRRPVVGLEREIRSPLSCLDQSVSPPISTAISAF